MRATTSVRAVERPNPGLYLLRLCPGGWPVPARITVKDGNYSAEIDGVRMNRTWTIADFQALIYRSLINEVPQSHPLLKLHWFGKFCSQTDYDHAFAMKEWAKRTMPDHPCLHPHQPIDPRLLPPVEFPDAPTTSPFYRTR
jgi:hypothetical protein